MNDELRNVFSRYGIAEKSIASISPFAPTEPDENVGLPPEFANFASEHSPFLIAVGGLEPEYDPLLQIVAMREIVASHPNAGLMIVGDGSMHAVAKQAVEASPARDNIILAGSVDHAVTLRLIDQANALLRTTLFDGDAISVREALHLGTPVIATDNGMRPDGVHLIARSDVAALIRTLDDIIAASAPKTRQAADRSNITAVVDLYSELFNSNGRGRS